MKFEFYKNKANDTEIVTHLQACDHSFLEKLCSRVNVIEYAHKILEKAVRFECWDDSELIGLVAMYCDDVINRSAFITNVSVLPAWQGNKIAENLTNSCIKHAYDLGFSSISLEVAHDNFRAINLYLKVGFVITEENSTIVKMNLLLK